MSLQLLTNLNFAEKINSSEAVTESGKELLKNYRGYCFANPANCSLVNNFINEAKNYRFDTGVCRIAESVLEFVNKNKISWQLATACESLNNSNSNYNYLAKSAVKTVESLLEMNESDVVSYIKAGALKGVQYVTEFRNICKDVYRNTIQESVVTTPQYMTSHPISYVHVAEGKTFFNVNNKTFALNEGMVEECVCDNTTFARVNALLESMKQTEDGNLMYEYKYSQFGNTTTFVVTESSLSIDKNGTVNEFDSGVSFMEHCDTVSRVMSNNERNNFMNVCGCMVELYEAFDNICELDQVTMLETLNGTKLALVEGKDNVNVTVFASAVTTGSETYDKISEALKDVEKISGVNMMSLFESRIDEEAKSEETENMKAIVSEAKDAKIEIRRRKIEALVEQYKNDPVRLAVLNKISKELQLLES